MPHARSKSDDVQFSSNFEEEYCQDFSYLEMELKTILYVQGLVDADRSYRFSLLGLTRIWSTLRILL